MSFAETFERLLIKAGKSTYRVSQYTGLDQAYVYRLAKGQRLGPSRSVVILLGLALASGNEVVGRHDVDELLLSAEYAPLRGKPS